MNYDNKLNELIKLINSVEEQFNSIKNEVISLKNILTENSKEYNKKYDRESVEVPQIKLTDKQFKAACEQAKKNINSKYSKEEQEAAINYINTGKY